MELTKHPKTELEYWATIEFLGGMVWHIEHEAAHGRFEVNEGLEKDLCDARQIMEMLASELFELFGVVHPKDCPRRNSEGEIPEAPTGMVWYWDWYEGMKAGFYKAEYEKLICSACALCEGVEAFISGNTIPCTVWRGMLYQLSRPYLCAMLSSGPQWSKVKLLT